jgi:hypothetical protein
MQCNPRDRRGHSVKISKRQRHLTNGADTIVIVIVVIVIVFAVVVITVTVVIVAIVVIFVVVVVVSFGRCAAQWHPARLRRGYVRSIGAAIRSDS